VMQIVKKIVAELQRRGYKGEYWWPTKQVETHICMDSSDS
jgi:hypothetical protein